MRANILHLLGITFQRIHKTVLGSYLQLEGAELDKLVSIHLGRGTGLAQALGDRLSTGLRTLVVVGNCLALGALVLVVRSRVRLALHTNNGSASSLFDGSCGNTND